MLQQNPDHSLDAVCLHRFPGEQEQVLEGVRGVGGLAQVEVQRRGLAGLRQPELLGRSLIVGYLC